MSHALTPWIEFGDGFQRTLTVHGEHLGYSIDAEVRPMTTGPWWAEVKRAHADAAQEEVIWAGEVFDDVVGRLSVDRALDAYVVSLGVDDV